MKYFETVTTETEESYTGQDENHFASVITAPSDSQTKQEQHSSGMVVGVTGHADLALDNERDLAYSCLLIPRFSDHYLAGDITYNLPVWLNEICISFGWRLESMIIRPGYLQWVLTVPASSNPARVMRLVRQNTSQKILSEFPRYKQQNLSGDFWAPGYSVISGTTPQSSEAISNFIQLTRKQQGIY